MPKLHDALCHVMQQKMPSTHAFQYIHSNSLTSSTKTRVTSVSIYMVQTSILIS